MVIDNDDNIIMNFVITKKVILPQTLVDVYDVDDSGKVVQWLSGILGNVVGCLQMMD